PVLHVHAPGQRREGEGLTHERRLRPEDETPLAHPIDEGAGHEGEGEHGRVLQRADQPEPERRVRQLEHQPGLPHRLHPGPDQRDELTGPEQAIVTVTQSPQSGRPSHRSWISRAGYLVQPRSDILLGQRPCKHASTGPGDVLRISVLHTAEYMSEGTLPVKDGVALTLQPDILDAIARGKGPRRALFAVGYAGWAPGQLEAEMKAGAWARASADEALIF